MSIDCGLASTSSAPGFAPAIGDHRRQGKSEQELAANPAHHPQPAPHLCESCHGVAVDVEEEGSGGVILPRRHCLADVAKTHKPQSTTLSARPNSADCNRQRAQPRTRGVATYPIYTHTLIPQRRRRGLAESPSGELSASLIIAPNNGSWERIGGPRKNSISLRWHLDIGKCSMGKGNGMRI